MRSARRWFAVSMLILAGLAGAWWLLPSGPATPTDTDALRTGASPAPGSLSIGARPSLPSEAQPDPRASTGVQAIDPVGQARDLGQVFDRYINSADPHQRQWAVRAFNACIPAFASSANHDASPEPLIARLPQAAHDERANAYRDLFARCHRLLSARAADIDGTRQSLERDWQTRSVGVRAREAVVAGELDRAELLVNQALAWSDPVEVASLTGLASRLAQSHQDEQADVQGLKLALTVDAAIPLVACDLGMDCSPQSLWSVQLCAAEGLCEGDLAARSMARLGSASPDPQAVQSQRNRLLALIKGGGALGLKDLLPK